jgi:hypothetical protein
MYKAGLWTGTAASWEALPSPPTGSWAHTYAYGIWSDGTTLFIVGTGRPTSTGRDEALLWTRPVCCRADFNCAGGVTVQDIFDFLIAYFGSDARADFSRDGLIGVQDIFDFLAGYFAGCP